MPMDSLDVGEPASLNARWINEDGSPATPTAVVLTITRPNGATIVKGLADLTALPDGSYRYVYTTDLPGVLEFTYDGTVAGNTSKQTGRLLVGENVDLSSPFEPWTTWEAIIAEPVLVTTGADVAAIPARQQELIIDSVSELLFNFSNNAFPGITKTTRSLCVGCVSCGAWWWWGDYGLGAATCCSCAPYERIPLRGRYPILNVQQVLIDGVPLDPSVFRVENQSDLVRVDGQAWPSGKDLTDPTAFQATWFYGQPIPAGGIRVATMMGAEATLAALNEPCLLPQYRIKTVNAEGITYTVVDTAQEVGKDRTGFQPADQWLDSLDEGLVSIPGMFDPGHAGVEARQVGIV